VFAQEDPQFKGGKDLDSAFRFFQDTNNTSQLQGKERVFRIADVVNGFKAFGYEDEAAQVEAFLKAIGNDDC